MKTTETRRIFRVIAVWVLLCVTAGAHAGFDEARAAWQRGDYAGALQELRRLAAQGDARAMNDLGAMYQNGKGVARNYRKAMRWYRKAARKGNVTALTNIGYLYDNGLGVKKNPEKAVEYYRKAAFKGDAVAQYNLGIAHWLGTGAQRNRLKAYVWVGLAASQGLKQALKVIKIMEYRMPPFVIKDGKEMIIKFYDRYVVPYRRSRPSS